MPFNSGIFMILGIKVTRRQFPGDKDMLVCRIWFSGDNPDPEFS